ncbi:putative amino acid transporter, amino acid-binding protein [Agrilactobacillus composti DSM 18527 = JCM 14202]|nr:transporter substrate-binding domain-containing protein [Agrilactobacillus composti]GAF40044.1 putative amino acid transporter, amino acid-binding protein [Agrilactobacillus composti DSM 18527 = JCM 14202]
MTRRTKVMIAGLLAILSAVVLSFTTSTYTSYAADQSVQKIKDSKTLVVGTSADYPPFEFPIMKNGKSQVAGYDMLIAQKIADDLGVKLKIVNTEFTSLIPELQDGKIDLILAGMVPTPEREKAVAFSDSYYDVQNVLLVQKKDIAKYKTAADVKGKQIGVQQSTTQQAIAKAQLSGAQLVTEGRFTSLTTELKQGDLAGVVAENAIAANYTKQYPKIYGVAKLKLTTPKQNRTINIAGRKGDKALIKQTNKTLAKLQKNGDLKTLFTQAQNTQLKYGK